MKLFRELFNSREPIKKSKPVEIPVKTYTKPTEKDLTAELIEKIHNEFYTAGDILLQEANIVLAKEVTREVDKGARLNKLGFNNTREAQLSVQQINERKEAERKMRIVTEYSVKYPNNKFITKEVVDRICQKYNLVFGDCSSYKGFVPEKNLAEIEAFKVKEEDEMYTAQMYSGFGSVHTSLVTKVEATREKDYGLSRYDHYSYSPASYRICAPLKDMIVRQDEEVIGNKIVKKHIPDPVVLCPVPNGFIIITAWGDEASDPELN